jgi:putative tryptophan/tyrosine transport system substrate-binding protein
MKRREFIVLVGCAAVWPLAALAQRQGQSPALIGWLSLQARGELLSALKDGLAAIGLKDGVDYRIEQRWSDDQFDRLALLAEELAAMRPSIIVTFPASLAVVAAKAAPATPIVVPTGELRAGGLVTNLAHPGGMITGISNITGDTTEKYLEYLTTILPQIKRVGFLADSTNLSREAFREAAHRSAVRFAIEDIYEEIGRPGEIEQACLRLARQGVQALVVVASSILINARLRIIELASVQRWPVIAWSSEWAKNGALLSYGIDNSANFRRAAYYIDRILKGANPGDLPVEQPVKLELVINAKTAKTLGLAIPSSLLALADEVIE